MTDYISPLKRTSKGVSADFVGGESNGKSVHDNIQRWLQSPVLASIDHDSVRSTLLDILNAHRDEIAFAAAHETGSPIAHHLHDIDTAIEYISTFSLPTIEQVKLDPKGTVLINLSANEPIIISIFMIVTGLLTNNRILLKPSSKSPWVSHFIVKKLHEAGIGLSQLGWCYIGPDDMERIIQKQMINNVISFGSHEVNKSLRTVCSQNQVEFYGESEGNDWMYIDKEFSVPTAEVIDWLVEGLTRHNGQMCDSIKGLLIHHARYEDIAELLTKRLNHLVVGDAESISTQIAITPEGRHNDILSRYEGIMYAGDARGCIVTEPDDTLMGASHFGLVSWMKSVKSIDEVVELYDKFNRHGVAFSVVSADDTVRQKVVENIRAARININTNPVDVATSSMWGGVKRSGQGGALHWWERFTNRKVINE